jgi:mRNA interferase RelE/StbE
MKEYQHLLQDSENKQDMLDVLEYREKLANDEEEAMPSEFAERLIFGENPILVWRECRGLKLKDISEATGIDSATLSRIENNKRESGVKQLQAISKALNLDIDDLL